MAKSPSLAKNGIFYLIYNIFNALFPFAIAIYLTKVIVLDTEVIGEVNYALNIVSYFALFAFVGIPTYGMREVAKCKDDPAALNKLFTELFLINTVTTTIACACYVALIFMVPAFRGELFMLYLIVGIEVVLNFFNISWLFEGLEKFGINAVVNVLCKTISFVFLVLFVKSEGQMLIYGLLSVLGISGYYFFLFLFFPKYVKFDFKGLHFKRHLKPILLLVVVNLAIEIYSLIDVTMIGVIIADSKAPVAYYKFAHQIQKTLLMVINTFTLVLVPRLAKFYKEEKYDDYNKLISGAFNLIIMLAIPMVIGVFFVSDAIVVWVYNEEFIASSPILKVLTLAILISPIGYLLGSRVCLVTNKEKYMPIAVGIGAVVNIGLNIWFIHLWGALGAAIASVASEVVVMVVYLIFSHKLFKLKVSILNFVKILVALLVMSGYLVAIYFLVEHQVLKICLEIVGAIIIYFGVLLLLREQTIFGAVKKLLHKGNNHPEIIEEPAPELTIEEVQQGGLVVLNKIKEICEKENIKYFLVYGTLIGAIRHKGFIPWDDDIDICMSRPDYERFINYFIEHQEELKPFELLHYRTNKKYIYPIVRVSDSRYKINYDNAKEYGLGLFVDIYPLDGYNPNDTKYNKKLLRLNSVIYVAGLKRMTKARNFLRNIPKFIIFIYTRFVSINRLLKKVDKLAQKYSYEDSEYVKPLVIKTLKPLAKKDIKELIEVDYEQYKYAIPKEYDAILKDTYGDYMELPPEEERVGHHFYKAYKK